MQTKRLISRRDFIRTSGLAGAALAIGLDSKASVHSIVATNEVLRSIEINPFILIDTSGSITIVNPRPDMGQGTIQSVPSLIAEELEVDLAQVTIIQSDGKSKYGSQTSGGSSSVSKLWIPLRKMGAAAKEMLITAAAKKMECLPG